MISTIFGKTKPINYIILLAFLAVFYGVVNFYIFEDNSGYDRLGAHLLSLIVLTFSVFAVNFVVKKNKLTETNSFVILTYTILFIVFPEVLTDHKSIFCSLFILLALWRLISLRTLINTKSKIFDATFWVLVASFFHEWALLFLLVVFASIYTYELKNIRNWLVPFVAFFTVFSLSFCTLSFLDKVQFFESHFRFQFNFEALNFLSGGQSVTLVLYVILILILSIFTFLKLGKSGLGKIISMRLVAMSFVIGLIVEFLITDSSQHPIILTFFPAAVFFTNYIEAINKPKLKEAVLITLVVLPISVLVIGMIVS